MMGRGATLGGPASDGGRSASRIISLCIDEFYAARD